MNLFTKLIGVVLIAIPCVSIAQQSYFEPESKEVRPTSSKPLITNYKGRLTATTYRYSYGKGALNCPQGTINFTTMEYPRKGKISASATYAGGTSTVRGKWDINDGSFIGHFDQNRYVRLHIKGKVLEDSAEGSLWFEVHRTNSHYDKNGICVTNFTAYPVR